jgi:pimeloyl-ACP methyl ester carboxylesterase
MDVLRAALGDEKLNYMGKSYGTFMGSLYAQLFPDKIGRLVLDGAVDPTISQYNQVLTQAVSFDNALTNLLKKTKDPDDLTVRHVARQVMMQKLA